MTSCKSPLNHWHCCWAPALGILWLDCLKGQLQGMGVRSRSPGGSNTPRSRRGRSQSGTRSNGTAGPRRGPQNGAESVEEVMLPAEFSPKLLRSSWLTLGSIAASYHFRQYDCCLLACVVLAASLNYWRHAVKGARRNMDMICATGGLAYQLFMRSHELISKRLHLIFMAYLTGAACGVISYLQARTNGARKRYDRASDWHRWLHFWGNVSNVILYYGLSL